MSAVASYAQAARGQAVSQPSPQLTSSSAPSTAGSQGKDDISTGNTSVTAPSVASNVTESRDADLNAQPDIENGLSKLDGEIAEQADCNSSTVSVAEQGEKPSQDRETKSRSSQRHTAEKGSRSTSRTSRVNDNTEGKKSRKSKKRAEKDSQTEQAQNENAEKPKEPVKPVVLTEAAIPAVNPWTKRAEVLQSKAKATSIAPSPSSNSDVVNETKNQESPEDGTNQAVSNGVNGEKPVQKKSAEAPRTAESAPRRAAPRGSRTADKEDKTSAPLPPVGDSTVWPDPKSAAAKEQQQQQQQPAVRKSQEKPEAADKDSQDDARPAGKKTWEKLEINHSVVFETQLPTTRGPKPRGGARGGRESGSMRGNLSSSNAASSPTSTQSTEKTGPSGGPSGPKPAPARPRDSSLPTRPAIQTQAPAASKRAPAEHASREQRKPSVSGNQEQARETTSENPAPSRRGGFTKDIRTENGPLSPEGTQTFTRSTHHERANGAHSHVNGHSFREGRPERGRGGYRGRGGHNGASAPHSGSAQFASNGYNASQASFQPRQNPSANSPPPFGGQFTQTYGHSGRGRGKWAGQHGRNANGANGSGFTPRASPAVSEFPAGTHMYAAPVVPPAHDYWTTVTILRTQIEYYFSIDNLCKDFHLRKYMDGSGFVPLSLIAGFRRIQQLTSSDPDLIRTACAMSDQLEIVRGDDQIERIRAPAYGTKFVFAEDQRVEEARNNGPANFEVLKIHPQAPGVFPLVYGQYYDDQGYSQAGYVNGAFFDPTVNGGPVNGHQYSHETQLSAVVPEFAPSATPATLESMTKLADSQADQLVLGLDNKDTAGVAGFVSSNPGHETPSRVDRLV